jgi:hypothetical protein
MNTIVTRTVQRLAAASLMAGIALTVYPVVSAHADINRAQYEQCMDNIDIGSAQHPDDVKMQLAECCYGAGGEMKGGRCVERSLSPEAGGGTPTSSKPVAVPRASVSTAQAGA